MKTDLDAFESRLLTELQAHVAERSTADGGADEWPRRSARPRFVLVAAGAAAAVAAVAVVVGLPGKGSSPAYSVGEGNAGQIHVEINRPEDASGLERALEEHGIAADITYLQALQTCALGRYTEVNRKFDGMGVEVGAAHLGAPSVRNRAGWRDVRSDLVGTAYECRGHQGCRAAGLPGCQSCRDRNGRRLCHERRLQPRGRAGGSVPAGLDHATLIELGRRGSIVLAISLEEAVSGRVKPLGRGE